MTDRQTAWNKFTQSEIKDLEPLLRSVDIELSDNQPHISGERFLMSGQKVVLIGKNKNTGQRLIIKSSTDNTSIKEIEAERKSRTALENLIFAYHPILAPKEVWYKKINDRVITITEFIEQPKPYLALPLVEQFDLIIDLFTRLSGVHITTSSHTKIVSNIFGNWNAKDYLERATKFVNEVQLLNLNSNLQKSLTDGQNKIASNLETIERYCNFLTHDDFALHNFRFHDNTIYLIDQSSLLFGNKHESWARFMNFMLLFNRDLELALSKHMTSNASPEEVASLKLLRIYKVIELLHYHCKAYSLSEGDTKKLSLCRIELWHQVLDAFLRNEEVDNNHIKAYQIERDRLRSKEEVARQRELQQLV